MTMRPQCFKRIQFRSKQELRAMRDRRNARRIAKAKKPFGKLTKKQQSDAEYHARENLGRRPSHFRKI